MAIVGNLAECQPAQIVRVIVQGRKTGRLTIQGADRTAEWYFRNGRLDALRLPDARPMLETLSAAGVLTGEQLAAVRAHAAQGDRALVALLDEQGYVKRSRLLATLRSQTTEAVQTIFTWDRGMFRLDEAVPLPDDSLALGLDLADLVAQAKTTVIRGGFEMTPPSTTPSQPAAPKKPRRWWDWLRGGWNDRRQ